MLDLTGLKDDISRLTACTLTTSVKEVRGPVVVTGRLPIPVGSVVRFGKNPAVVQTDLQTVEHELFGEVTGFSDRYTYVAPYSTQHQIAPDTSVTFGPETEKWEIDSSLLGAVLDNRGRIAARLSDPDPRFSPVRRRVAQRRFNPPDPLTRRPAVNLCQTGIRVIDGFVTLAHGQRIAIFAEPGVGKSTLLSTIAKNAADDVTVIALIGERGREVGDFIRALNPAVYSRTTVVQATSDLPGICRINAALTATAIAEYFRDNGLSVLLLCDSLTRLLRAGREVGLSSGELPVRRGYPPSVFSALPALIERTGNSDNGSITALYTVLLSADLDEDPMVEEIKGLTDGHILLSRELAEAGVFPAVDPLRSLSRLQAGLITAEQSQTIVRLRAALSRASRDRELAALGGTVDQDLARAFFVESELRKWLTQPDDICTPFNQTIKRLAEIEQAAAE